MTKIQLAKRIEELKAELAWCKQGNENYRTELAAANATIAQLNDDLTEAAQVADADNETVAALVSRIEDEKVTALRDELAAANAKVAELTETCAKFAEQANSPSIPTYYDMSAWDLDPKSEGWTE